LLLVSPYPRSARGRLGLEGGERRVDVVEYVEICDAVGTESGEILKALLRTRRRLRFTRL
jgi:hypothetical protein